MLTDTKCRTAKPKEKLYRINDFNGLYLEVKPNGKKAWRFRFQINGKSSMLALGNYPLVTLAEARSKCDDARKLVSEGINPTQAKQLDKIRKANESANTFQIIAKEWLQMKDWADVTKYRRLDMLERIVFPSIGTLPIREITSHHILKILQREVQRGAPTVAAEAKRTISSIFEFAVATLRADSDPVWAIRKALPANKTQHKKALTTDQIGQLLNNFDNSRGTFQLNYCMWLMWWTLSRPSEVAEAEWSEFDLDNALWTIPAERMKARREHIVPLPTQAIAILKSLYGFTGSRKHLFPGRDSCHKPMSTNSLRQFLKTRGWSVIYNPHATRTTGSTRLNELGYRPDAIEAQLAHMDSNSVRHSYNHATYLEERKIMMQDWADKLDIWVKRANFELKP